MSSASAATLASLSTTTGMPERLRERARTGASQERRARSASSGSRRRGRSCPAAPTPSAARVGSCTRRARATAVGDGVDDPVERRRRRWSRAARRSCRRGRRRRRAGWCRRGRRRTSASSGTPPVTSVARARRRCWRTHAVGGVDERRAASSSASAAAEVARRRRRALGRPRPVRQRAPRSTSRARAVDGRAAGVVAPRVAHLVVVDRTRDAARSRASSRAHRASTTRLRSCSAVPVISPAPGA